MNTIIAWPVTSKAFSLVNIRANDETPGSPPRKAPRLSNTSSRVVSGADYRSTKRLTISNIHDEPRLDPRENKKTIETMLRTILNRTEVQSNPLPLSHKRLFEAVEAAILLLDNGAEIYSMLTTHLQRTCAEVIARRLTSEKGLPWLKLLIDEWKWFESRLVLLKFLFTWLDRAYTCPKGIPSIYELGLQTFQNYVICHNAIHDEITPCIENWVNTERTTQTVATYRDQITILIHILQQMGLYESEFQVPYVLICQKFYANESDVLSLNGMSPIEFIGHCLRRVEEEVRRCRDLLQEKTLTVVEKCTEKALLEKRIPWIIAGLLPLLREKNIEGIRNMYDLLARVEAFEPIRLAFAQSTETIVTEIVLLPVNEEEEMVSRLLQFRAFVDTLIVSAFREGGENGAPLKTSDEKGEKPAPAKTRGPFAYAASDAFARGFGKRLRKPAEMIAKYIDRLMRYGQKEDSDRDFDEKLDSVLSLYQYTTDRDVFRTFYWRSLAKRLLLGRSASDDFEKAVIKKLREDYDPEFGKGNQMFKDLELSRDLLSEFHTKFPELKYMSTMILQSSSWPYQPKQGREIDLQPQLLSNLEQFEKFYRIKHERHKIDWYHSLGTVTLTARFPVGQKELSVSLYQAVVLMLFNEKDKFSFLEIKEQTNLEDAELRRTLQSLACGKKRVLTKVPAGRDVNDGDEFHYNAKFTDPHHNIRINSIQEKVTIEESQATDKRIQEDRSYLLDAAIVRIMKGRKKLSHPKLIQEAVEAIKKHFQPDVSQIKKQIESLTEREYIRRDELQRELYHYVA